MLIISFVIIWLLQKHSKSLFPLATDSVSPLEQNSVSNPSDQQNGRRTGEPLPPPRTNRRISRQALTESVDGEGTDPVQL